MRRVRNYLLPDAAERDVRFHEELLQQSCRGLRLLGLVEVASPILMHLADLPGQSGVGAPTGETLALITIGALTFALGFLPNRFSRVFAILSAWLAAGALVVAPGYSLAAISVLILTAVAVIPLQPRQTLGLGLATGAVYLVGSRGIIPAAPHGMFVAVLTLVSAASSAEIYAQRRADYAARQRAVRDAGVLASAKARAQLAESAVAIGRFAAALSHEINSPLGTLASSSGTLRALAEKQSTAPAEERSRLLEIQAELGGSIQIAYQRLQEVAARLQRFIDLDRAELKEADLNQLIGDAAVAVESRVPDEVRLEFDLAPLPKLNCRPQLLSVAFSQLISNAREAVSANGRVRVSTRRVNSHVEIRIEDNGRGIPPEEMEEMFDPSFKVAGDRVRGANWNLFNSRQIVFEHGGNIDVSSVLGRGTTVSITLPVDAPG